MPAAEILRCAQDDNVVLLGNKLLDSETIAAIAMGAMSFRTAFLAGGFGFCFLGHLGEAGFDDFFQEGGGEGAVDGEADGAFGDVEAGEIGAEFVDDEVAHGEEAAVVFEGGDGADGAVVFEGGDAVAEGFDGFAGAGGEDGGADGLEGGASGLGEAREIFGDGLGVGRGTRGAFWRSDAVWGLFHLGSE